MSDRELLLEIYQMLVKICNYIDKIESPEYQNKMDEKNYTMDVAANLTASRMEDMVRELINR